MDDLHIPSRTLRGREIENVFRLDRTRPQSRPPKRTLPTIEKRMSKDARLPPGGGHRQIHEPVRACASPLDATKLGRK